MSRKKGFKTKQRSKLKEFIRFKRKKNKLKFSNIEVVESIGTDNNGPSFTQ